MRVRAITINNKRLVRGSDQDLLKPAWKTVLIVFIVARVFLSIWMWGVRQIYTKSLPPDPVLRPYVGVDVEYRPWLEVWQRWDTLHYQAIAERGYKAFDSALFVPPLYPLLMHALAKFMGGDTLIAGIVLSNVFYIGCLYLLYRLSITESYESEDANRSLAYLASFPTAFFLLAAYTESLYLFFAILALSSARKRSWLLAGISGAFAAMSRLPGALIAIPLAYTAWLDWQNDRNFRSCLAPILAIFGAAVFPLFVWIEMGLSPMTPFIVQSSRFHGEFTLPGVALFTAFKQMFAGTTSVTNILELIFALVFLAGLVPVWKGLPRIFGVYYLSILTLYLSRTGDPYPLIGMTRYVLALFPIFLIFGRWGSNPWANRAILYPSWMLLLYLSGQFAIWGWAG